MWPFILNVDADPLHIGDFNRPLFKAHLGYYDDSLVLLRSDRPVLKDTLRVKPASFVTECLFSSRIVLLNQSDFYQVCSLTTFRKL